MFWKRMPYWLLGGIVGAILGIPLALLTIGFSLGGVNIPIYYQIANSIFKLGVDVGNKSGAPILFSTFIIFNFLIGAIIGYIVGNIKNRGVNANG
jgi:hypothetical protein